MRWNELSKLTNMFKFGNNNAKPEERADTFWFYYTLGTGTEERATTALKSMLQNFVSLHNARYVIKLGGEIKTDAGKASIKKFIRGKYLADERYALAVIWIVEDKGKSTISGADVDHLKKKLERMFNGAVFREERSEDII